MRTYFLRIETTGFEPTEDQIFELAVIGYDGSIVLDTLIRPKKRVRHTEISHGFAKSMLRSAPQLEVIWPELRSIIKEQRVVIYNAPFARKFFPNTLRCAAEVPCAMRRFAEFYGERRNGTGGFQWKTLRLAAAYVGSPMPEAPQRALEHVRAVRDVWLWMEAQTQHSSDRNPGSVLRS